MFTGILCVTALLALLAMLVFGEMSFFTLIMLAISVGGIALKILSLRLPGKRLWQFVLAAAGIAAVCVAFLVPGAKKVKNSTYDYGNRVLDVEEMILTLDENADHALAELEADYGESDRTLGLHAYLSMMEGNHAEAYDWLDRMSDRTSKEYYARLETLYLTDPEQEDTEALYRLYKEALRSHPDWGYMQCMTGIAEYEKGNLKVAQYYLDNTLKQEPDNSTALYYLGAIACKWGDYTGADTYFRASIENGASEQMRAWMTMYMNQAE